MEGRVLVGKSGRGARYAALGFRVWSAGRSAKEGGREGGQGRRWDEKRKLARDGTARLSSQHVVLRSTAAALHRPASAAAARSSAHAGAAAALLEPTFSTCVSASVSLIARRLGHARERASRRNKAWSLPSSEAAMRSERPPFGGGCWVARKGAGKPTCRRAGAVGETSRAMQSVTTTAVSSHHR